MGPPRMRTETRLRFIPVFDAHPQVERQGNTDDGDHGGEFGGVPSDTGEDGAELFGLRGRGCGRREGGARFPSVLKTDIGCDAADEQRQAGGEEQKLRKPLPCFPMPQRLERGAGNREAHPQDQEGSRTALVDHFIQRLERGASQTVNCQARGDHQEEPPKKPWPITRSVLGLLCHLRTFFARLSRCSIDAQGY